MKTSEITLEQSKFYHIFCSESDNEILFNTKEDYSFFLNKYYEYLSEYVETYAFCLLPSHFHILVRVKEQDYKKHLRNSDNIIPDPFQNLCESYIEFKNKKNLFHKPFNLVEVKDETCLVNLIFCIHANPQLHGISRDFRMYTWSSYEETSCLKPSIHEQNNFIDWFNSKYNYLYYYPLKYKWLN